jgi:hypothetical protein
MKDDYINANNDYDEHLIMDLFARLSTNNALNTIVEIIEDNDKIDEEAKPITKESIEALGYVCGEFQKCFTSGWTKALENKPLNGNNKLEKIKWGEKESRAGHLRADEEIEILARRTEKLKKKIAELVDHINKIEEKLEEDK